VLDRERILAKIDELEGFLRDLRTIAPESFTVYQQTGLITAQPLLPPSSCTATWR